LHTWYLYGLLMPVLIPILHAVFIRPEAEGNAETVYGKIVRKPHWMLLVCVVFWGIVISLSLYLASLGGGTSAKELAYQQDLRALESKSRPLETSELGGSAVINNADEQDLQTPETNTVPLATFEFKEFICETADVDTKHSIRIKLSFAYDKNNVSLLTELTEKRSQVFDLMMLTISSKTARELDTAVRKQKLKKDLIKIINRILKSGKIADIFYAEFSVI